MEVPFGVFLPNAALRSRQRCEQRRCDVKCQTMLKELREKRRALEQTKRKIAMDMEMLNEAKDGTGKHYTGVGLGDDGALYYDVRVTRARNRIPLRKVHHRKIGSLGDADMVTPDVVKARRLLLRLRQSQSAKLAWRGSGDQEGRSKSAPGARQRASGVQEEKSAELTSGVQASEAVCSEQSVSAENRRAIDSRHDSDIKKGASVDVSSSQSLSGGSIDGDCSGNSDAFRAAIEIGNFNEINHSEMMTPYRYSPIRKHAKPRQAKPQMIRILLKEYPETNRSLSMSAADTSNAARPGMKVNRFAKAGDRVSFSTLKTDPDRPVGKKTKHIDKSEGRSYNKSPGNQLPSWIERGSPSDSSPISATTTLCPAGRGDGANPSCYVKSSANEKANETHYHHHPDNESESLDGLEIITNADSNGRESEGGVCHEQDGEIIRKVSRVSFKEDVVIANYYEEDEREGEQLFWSSDEDLSRDELFTPPSELLDNVPSHSPTHSIIWAQITYHGTERLKSPDTSHTSNVYKNSTNLVGVKHDGDLENPNLTRHQSSQRSNPDKQRYSKSKGWLKTPVGVADQRRSRRCSKTIRETMVSAEQGMHKALEKLRISPTQKQLGAGEQMPVSQASPSDREQGDQKVKKLLGGKTQSKASGLPYRDRSSGSKIKPGSSGYLLGTNGRRLSATDLRSLSKRPGMRLLREVQKHQEQMTRAETIEISSQRSLFLGD